MAARKPKPPPFDALGGTMKWTPKGLTIFVPQSIVSDWEMAEVSWDEESEAIVIQRVEDEEDEE